MLSPKESSSIVHKLRELANSSMRRSIVENGGKNKENFAQQNRPWEFLPSP